MLGAEAEISKRFADDNIAFKGEEGQGPASDQTWGREGQEDKQVSSSTAKSKAGRLKKKHVLSPHTGRPPGTAERFLLLLITINLDSVRGVPPRTAPSSRDEPAHMGEGSSPSTLVPRHEGLSGSKPAP